MSSRLQLDVRNLSLGMRHPANAYEVKAGIGVIAGNTVIHAWASCVYYKNERYINTLTFTFSFYVLSVSDSLFLSVDCCKRPPLLLRY